MEYGNSLRKFMEWGASSDHVIVVHSDKYWRSPDCMYELKMLFDAVRNRKKDFLSVIVPVEHLNSNVRNKAGISQHAKYWREFPDDELPARLPWDIDELRDHASSTIRDFGQQLSDNLQQNIPWDDTRRQGILEDIARRIGLDSESSEEN